MKKIKVILILLVLVILSGCSVNANITMNEKGNIKEEIKVLTPSSIISNKKSRIDSYVKTAIESYKPVINRRKYSTSVVNNPKGDSGALLTNNHDNICKFIENTIFSQYLYNNIECTDDEDYYEVKSTSKHIKYCANCTDWPEINEVNLKITLPVKADESDADEVSGNTYVWRYDENTGDDKTLYLRVSKKKIKDNEIKLKKQRKTRMVVLKIIVLIVLLSAIIFIFSKLYKKYKNNNLEY